MRFILAILAVLLPPLSLWFWRGVATSTIAISAIWLIGHAVFWLLWAGPGFLIMVVSSLAAIWVILRKPKARKS